MEKIVEFMKRNYKVLVIVAALSAVLWSFMPSKKAEDGDKDKMLLELLSFVLEKDTMLLLKLMMTFQKKLMLLILSR